MSELPPLNISHLPPLHPPERLAGEDNQENATAFITEEFIDEWENLLFKKANADVLDVGQLADGAIEQSWHAYVRLCPDAAAHTEAWQRVWDYIKANYPPAMQSTLIAALTPREQHIRARYPAGG